MSSLVRNEKRIGSEIRVENLRKTYGKFHALDGVSLTINAGEFVSILGPSGSGKTTMLMSIAGFSTPTSGKILVGGEDIVPKPAHKRDIGIVFQKYSLFPHMTVAQNVAFPLRMRKWSKEKQAAAVAEALARVQLGHLADRYPSQLSGGQQQRVALARAIVFDPPLLLMDEPLGALDKKLREELQLEIKLLHERLGITIIFVTHDQQEALAMSDRIAVMNNGQIEQIGTPSELYRAPHTEFVSGFVGSSNTFAGVARGYDAAQGLQSVETAFATLQVRLDDPSRALPAGQACSLVVRPEAVRIQSGPGANAFPAEVISAMFAGAHTDVTAVAGDQRILLQLSGDASLVELQGAGKDLQLAVAPQDLMLFPRTGGEK